MKQERGVAPPPCRGLGELFFSDDATDIERAKQVCASCGASADCLAEAQARREACGVWGGKLIRDGQPLEVTPRRGRPPGAVPAA